MDEISEITRIIIAAPDGRDFEAVVKAVEDLNVELVWANTPEETLEQALQGTSIVVASCQMMMQDGETMFTILRREVPALRLRTLLVATPEDIAAHARAFELGADDFLVWPINPSVFRARIVAGLRILRAEKERIELQRRDQLHATITTVAHEINNPLFAVMGNLEMLREELEARSVSTQDEFMTECLDTMQQECKRIANVVQRLRDVMDPELTTYHGETQMLELPDDGQGTERK